MRVRSAGKASLTTAVLATLVACGGGGGAGGTPAEPGTGAALAGSEGGGGTEGTDQSDAEGTTVEGRVADGYLRGATVCVDVDLNGRCDDGEPQATSTAGGRYVLEVPPEHADKPLVADVPAEAIDEDTGEPIGKVLALGTTADRPGFISPITTLVLEELKGNPALDIESAERNVQGALGLAGDSGASLFEDYVAGGASEDGSEALREDFHYLHQTARVVAGMMHEIRRDVEAAAVGEGLDVDGDDKGHEALQRLVRREIKKGLPEIARAVAAAIREERIGDAGDSPPPAGGGGGAGSEPFDPDRVVLGLRESGEFAPHFGDVVERLDAIRAEREPVLRPIRELLAEGVYWVAMECEGHDGRIHVRGMDPDDLREFDGRPSAIGGSEEGSGGDEMVCEASYGTLRVSGEDDLIELREFGFDSDRDLWVEESKEHDESPYWLRLVDGQWVPVVEGGPAGAVTFTADGAAIMRFGEGEIQVRASSRELDDDTLLSHLRRVGVDPDVEALIDRAAVFPPGSVLHLMVAESPASEPRLFNWQSSFEESGFDQCAEWSGNCNVVSIRNANFQPATSIDLLRAGSLDGILLADLTTDQHEYRSIDVRLEGVQKEDGGLPVEGRVTWMLAAEDEQPDGVEGESPKDSDPDYADADGDVAFDDDGREHTDGVELDRAAKVLGRSRWRLIVVDETTMIEIAIPFNIAHRVDDDNASLLLIEQGGYVRRGAMTADSVVEELPTYSLPAFEALRKEAERVVGK